MNAFDRTLRDFPRARASFDPKPDHVELVAETGHWVEFYLMTSISLANSYSIKYYKLINNLTLDGFDTGSIVKQPTLRLKLTGLKKIHKLYIRGSFDNNLFVQNTSRKGATALP